MSNQIYDYLLSKANIENVLNHYSMDYNIKHDTIWMCCPFHHETEPSFSFNMDKKIYKCWGCKVKGNLISFIKEYELLANGEELSYYDSALKLSRICKIKINLSEKEKLEMEMEALDDISELFENDVVNPQVQETFLDSAIKKFYVKKNNYMENKGYKKEILDYLEMGFYTGDPKNPMNNRCIFPIRNQYGQLVGWTGRTILDIQPKWIHAPAKRFLKSLNLFNIDKAIDHIYEDGCINVVESPGNTIRMLESGKFNTVATLGSTISKEQCDILLSYGVPIIFWYDWDSGGFEGLELVIQYITNYDILFVAITDYGVNENGKAKDIGDVDTETVNNTKIVSIYEYIEITKERYVKFMDNEFEKDKKIKLTDGTVVLCTNTLNPKLDIKQMTPSDITFIKNVDTFFNVTELSAFEG